MADKTRLNVNLSPRADAQLRALAEDQGKTVAATVRSALSRKRWLSDLLRDGSKILVEDRWGRQREVIFQEAERG